MDLIQAQRVHHGVVTLLGLVKDGQPGRGCLGCTNPGGAQILRQTRCSKREQCLVEVAAVLSVRISVTCGP